MNEILQITIKTNLKREKTDNARIIIRIKRQGRLKRNLHTREPVCKGKNISEDNGILKKDWVLLYIEKINFNEKKFKYTLFPTCKQ